MFAINDGRSDTFLGNLGFFDLQQLCLQKCMLAINDRRSIIFWEFLGFVQSLAMSLAKYTCLVSMIKGVTQFGDLRILQ